MEWQGPEPERTESLMFLYDGGVVDDSNIRLHAIELRAHTFVAETELEHYLSERLKRRIRARLLGLRHGRMVEMDNGRVLLDNL